MRLAFKKSKKLNNLKNEIFEQKTCAHEGDIDTEHLFFIA